MKQKLEVGESEIRERKSQFFWVFKNPEGNIEIFLRYRPAEWSVACTVTVTIPTQGCGALKRTKKKI